MRRAGASGLPQLPKARIDQLPQVSCIFSHPLLGMPNMRLDGRRQGRARGQRLQRMTVDGRRRARLIHEIKECPFLQQHDQVRRVECQRALERLQLFFTARKRAQGCRKAQPERQLLRGERNQLFQERAGSRRIATNKESARTLVQHEGMIGKNRLRLAPQSLCIRVTALGHETFNVCHERRHFLLFGDRPRLYRSHVHV